MGDASIRRLVNFSICRARKVEVKKLAETKRQTGIKLIETWIIPSGTGVHPLETFPTEIWEKILSLIQEPSDLYGVWRSHEFFQDMLQEHEINGTMLLLPLCLEIPKFRRCLQNTTDFKTDNKIPSESMVQLRLVCKKWRDWMDNHLEREILKMKMVGRCGRVTVGHHKYPKMLSLHWHITSNMYDDDYFADEFVEFDVVPVHHEKMLKAYTDLPNPATKFPLRSLSANFGSTAPVDDSSSDGEYELREAVYSFAECMIKLLKLFGDQIWHFQFELTDFLPIRMEPEEIYSKLQEWVSLMPNLKWLTVSLGKRIDHPYNLVGKLHNLREAIISNPFPHLEDLTSLLLLPVGDTQIISNPFHYLDDLKDLASIQETILSTVVYGAILESNAHLKELALSGKLEGAERVLPYIHSELIQLNGFSLSGFGPRPIMDINRLTNFSWSLKDIYLCLGTRETNFVISMPRLFEYLERFQTLECVHLKMINMTTEEMIGDNLRLHLPNLTYFNLEYMFFKHPSGLSQQERAIYFDHFRNHQKYFVLNLDYLFHCKKLEYLEWRKCISNKFKCRPSPLPDHQKVIHFQGAKGDLYKSNLWQIFPFLHTAIMNRRKIQYTKKSRQLY